MTHHCSRAARAVILPKAVLLPAFKAVTLTATDGDRRLRIVLEIDPATAVDVGRALMRQAETLAREEAERITKEGGSLIGGVA